MTTAQMTAGGETSPDATPTTNAEHLRRACLITPLVLVNAAAIWGQAGWAYEHITNGGGGGVVIALLFAAAVESIGIYLAVESYEALMSDQPSGLLRMCSYGVGVFAGVLNYLHFAGSNQTQAIVFGAMSAISPWLWGIWSRARNRSRLAELGMVDTRAVKLGAARILFWPGRSLGVIRHAAWAGMTDPREAVRTWNLTWGAEAPASVAPAVIAAEAVRVDPVAAKETASAVAIDYDEQLTPVSQPRDAAPKPPKPGPAVRRGRGNGRGRLPVPDDVRRRIRADIRGGILRRVVAERNGVSERTVYRESALMAQEAARAESAA